MNTFESDPRSFALELVEQGYSAENLLLCALKYMSHDDVRGMLDCNELSPRFDEDEDEPEYPIADEDELRDAFWLAFPQFERSETDDQQNSYCTDIRIAWCDYIDSQHRDGNISDELVSEATL